MRLATDTAVAALPAPPSWTQTIKPIDFGREFSAGFGEKISDTMPQYPVELVQSEYIDDQADSASVRRGQPRLYFNGDECSPEQSAELIQLIQAALAAIDHENTDEPGR